MALGSKNVVIYQTLLLLCFAAAVSAHGNGASDMNTEVGGMSEPATQHVDGSVPSNSTQMGPPSYFRHPEYSTLMVGHIVLMSIGWIFTLPLAVMLSISQSRISLLANFLFLLLNAFGLLLGTIYNAKTPDLYPNNLHHKMGWVLTWIVCAEVCIAVIKAYNQPSKDSGFSRERMAFIPVSTEAIVEHQRLQNVQSERDHPYSSNSSNEETEPSAGSSRSHSMSSTVCDENQEFTPHSYDDNDDEDGLEKPTAREGESFVSRKLTHIMSSRTFRVLDFMFEITNRLIIILGFVALTSGIVTYAGIFRANQIFSGLAHFIKGSVFLWYGILTLGRWAGCFANLGWAWNIKPSNSSKPSAEFVESFLIFLYGSTNVFLEHLGSSDGEWSPQDLEHLSITIMFFGGGLCGMLIESSKIRDLLNATVLRNADGTTHNPNTGDIDSATAWKAPKTYRFSMNPLPALIVLLLGMMMSSHHQASMVSTMIHGQWGSLLIGAGFARAATYFLFYLSPPSSFLPSRPPTELITAFCLMAGGLIFMASSSDTVAAMEFNDIDAMFVFTVTMGVVMFLMAWIIFVIAVKGWAVSRQSKLYFAARSVS